VLLDEASRWSTESDDQIGRSLSKERRQIFNKFGLSSLVAIPSRDEGIFVNVQRQLGPCRPSVDYDNASRSPVFPLATELLFENGIYFQCR
jgi:hypothetical protein